MLEKRTVLILGAGASCPYGFPAGEGLFHEVREALKGTGHHQLASQALLGLGYKQARMDSLCEALLNCGLKSVDAFLEDRSEFLPLGKAAMAAVLIRRENHAAMFPSPPEDWYKHLYNALRDDKGLLVNPVVSVITFNYDRSLEHYLWTALSNSLGCAEDELLAYMENIPIVHVHGMLAPLPWQDGDARGYRSEVSADEVRKAAAGIRIVSEGSDGLAGLSAAAELLGTANNICFLGFGYHRANVERLPLDQVRRGAKVYRPTWGMHEREHNLAQGHVSGRLSEGVTFSGRESRFFPEDWSIADYLRDVPVLT